MSQLGLAKSAHQFTVMQNDVTVTEDYGHGDSDVQDHLFGKDLMDARAAGGLKNLCVEYDPKIQKGISQLNDVGFAKASGKNIPDGYIDDITDRYATWMQDNVGRMGMETGSKEEFQSFKKEAESFVYAGEKGIKVHAVDSGEHDMSKRLDADGKVADKVAEISKTGKTELIIGSAHSTMHDGTNGKGVDEYLQEKGLKVGKIGVVGDMSDLSVNAGKEYPNTVVQTDANGAWPGTPTKVMQIKNGDNYSDLGGETNVNSPEAQNSQYSKLSEKDLGLIAPPEVFDNTPRATPVIER